MVSVEENGGLTNPVEGQVGLGPTQRKIVVVVVPVMT
jgi:hypothetical protein